MAFFIFGSSMTFGQVTLRHSYTFEDGTVDDGTGSADGTLQGDATVVDGALILTGNGYATLPAKEIDVPSYTAISMEAVYKQAPGLEADNTFTVLYSFGQVNPSTNWMGINYFLYQPTRKDDNVSRFSMSCLNTGDPWATETGVSADEISDTNLHYVATIITATELKIYQDGALLGIEPLDGGDNSLANVSNDTAFLGASVYPNDAKWKGKFYELNIFEGELDKETILIRAEQLLKVPIANATLSEIKTNKGDLSPTFDPETNNYTLSVEYGTTQINLEPIALVFGADVEIEDGLGTTITDGIISWTGNTGNTAKITVTALNGNTKKEYNLLINVNPKEETASLLGVKLSEGYLTQDFDMDSLNYEAIVPFGTTSVVVTDSLAWSGATVTGNKTVTLTDGKGSTSLTVTSEDGNTTKVYTIDFFASKVTTGQFYYIVNEASPSEDDKLVLSGSHVDLIEPVIDIAINDNNSQLFEFVASGVDNQFYIRNKVPSYLSLAETGQAEYLMEMRSDLTGDLDSCRFELDEFEPGRFRIYSVTRSNSSSNPTHNMLSPDGVEGSNLRVYSDKWIGSVWDIPGYTIWNILPPNEVVDPYDTYLSSLSIDGIDLHPAFKTSVKEYYVTLPIDTTSITVSAVVNNAAQATVSGTGVIDVSGGSGSITITVTAIDDANYTRDYVIYYQKDTPLTLKHSYTFGDGTARDQEGTADGIVADGAITDGIYTASKEGDYISLPSEEIVINTYPSITLEAYVTTGENLSWTTFAYFGNSDASNSHYISLAGENDVSRTVINQGLGDKGPEGVEPGAGEDHHYVSILTNDSLFWYIDGALVDKYEIDSNSYIHNISTEEAWLCKTGYPDATWIGSIHEFNIYSGQMNADTIAKRATLFPVEDSTTDATLSDIAVNGTTIDNFASYTLEYEVPLRTSITVVPTITATTTNTNAATPVITEAAGIPGTTTIEVTAEDGITINTYMVNFVYVLSDTSTLTDLTVNGTTITGFNPLKLDYEVILGSEVTVVPTVDGTPASGATYVVRDAKTLPGITSIVVTAENEIDSSIYTVSFKYQVSSDATLSDIKVNGTTIEGFDAATINYIVDLPAGTTAIPTVTATSTDSNADVSITDATAIPGMTTIAVIAEDGVTKKNYFISFRYSSATSNIAASTTKVYPTIFNNSFKVLTSEGSYKISVHDITGKSVFEQKNIMGEIEISIPNSGMYFVEVEGNGLREIFKVFKVK